MNRTIFLALGILLTITASVTGLVIIPNWQFQELKPVVKSTGLQYPERWFGDAHKGREIYINQGCIYCHTQQVREKNYGGDIRRGWGNRRSVPRDYIFDRPHQLGTMRTGPDLASIAMRQPSGEWHALHLYDPQLTSPGSVMPRFNYLFRELITMDAGQLPANAIKLPANSRKPDVHYIVPTERGAQLITYLKRLNQSFPLPEAQQ